MNEKPRFNRRKIVWLWPLLAATAVVIFWVIRCLAFREWPPTAVRLGPDWWLALPFGSALAGWDALAAAIWAFILALAVTSQKWPRKDLGLNLLVGGVVTTVVCLVFVLPPGEGFGLLEGVGYAAIIGIVLGLVDSEGGAGVGAGLGAGLGIGLFLSLPVGLICGLAAFGGFTLAGGIRFLVIYLWCRLQSEDFWIEVGRWLRGW